MAVHAETILADASRPGGVRSPDRGACRRYGDTFAGFTAAEIDLLSQAKRFFECHDGDREFRASVDAGGRFTEAQRAMLRDIGVTFEPEAVELLWKAPGLFSRIYGLTPHHGSFDDLPADIHASLAPYPVLKTWFRWCWRRDFSTFAYSLDISVRPTANAAYTAWRARRVAAVRNELGWYGLGLDHPCHAVEMAVGCSVGCGFCAYDAGRLETVFDGSTPENRELVAGVAAGMHAVLGWPAEHGMLYWSTEPNDNPDYVNLLRLWEQCTGAVLCTSTARAHEPWIRELIDYYSTRSFGPSPWPRVSVLTRTIMRRLHKAFTPLEMRDTKLLMQQKDAEALRDKVPGGRERMLKRLVETEDLRDVDFDNPPADFKPPQGSIACVSGLLVNMVNRTLKLASPCYTSLEYPYGYRVYDEAGFGSPGDFEVALRRMVRRSMVARPYPEMPLRWRDDLKVVPRPDGFTLVSPATRRDFRRGELHRRVAELIGRDGMTYRRALDAMAESPRVGPVKAGLMLGSLFDKGYLCELAITRDYRARREAADWTLREPIRPVPVAMPAPAAPAV